MRVIDLVPGTIIKGRTYICQSVHPLYRSLQLITWFKQDGTVELDAMQPGEFVGTPIPATEQELEQRLKSAFMSWKVAEAVSPLTAPIVRGKTNV